MNSDRPYSTKMHEPLVAIFMPVYNGERYLAATLDSLLSQTYRNFEIVIVNDGSTDATGAIAAAYASRDPRVRIVAHEKNCGLSAARNTGWQSVTPEASFLMNHDGDDISLPHKLSALVAYMQRHPEIDAVGSLCRNIDATGKVVGWVPIEWQPSCIRATFGRVNSMVISATLVRRRLYDGIAPFQAEYGGCDDYDFWARALAAGFQCANVPQVLHHVRVHQASMGSTSRDAMRASAERIAVRYRGSYESSPGRKLRAALCAGTARYRIATMRLLREQPSDFR